MRNGSRAEREERWTGEGGGDDDHGSGSETGWRGVRAAMGVLTVITENAWSRNTKTGIE